MAAMLGSGRQTLARACLLRQLTAKVREDLDDKGLGHHCTIYSCFRRVER